MKRALVICGVGALALILVVLGVAWFVFSRPLSAARHFLLHEVNHHAVSVACLDMMTQPQYQPLIDQYPSGADPQLPPAIRDVRAFWLAVSTNRILIMKTGGFYHMGFVFERSATSSNAYELVFHEEKQNSSDILRYTLRVPTTAPNTPLHSTPR
jgi:hypothetical protein